ncbi:LysE family translocator [Amycolatopsis sp. K13G38]|uniref:LysE family translocator n=1 Tax=Amycolatopsis acididurans TaxID=2724524 RepID=A0ABX1J6C8_9PSEU|nr:LysE family translocator [Amycolatopsis acididurans]NKQ54881.1 LysE family translocator [Amycolatopsis acididurans]
MTWNSYGTYLIFVILVVLAPGPDTLVTLKNALSGGTRGGLLSTWGILIGNLLQGTAVGLGLGALIVRSQPLFLAVRWAGVVYLCYLGFQALRGAWRGDYRKLDEFGARSTSFRRWREGFLSNVTNPKVLALYLSVLPQFLDPGKTSAWDALVLAYTVAILGAVWLLVLVMLVHRVRAWLQRRRVRRSLDAVTGTALVGFGVALALEG